MLRNNPQVINNPIAQNVFRLIDSRNHDGLVELLKNTCQNTGNNFDDMMQKIQNYK